MVTVLVTEKGGDSQRLDYEKAEVNIGRVKGNDVVLPKGNVSKRHARVVVMDGKFIVVDLKSTNGTYVNGKKVSSPVVIGPSDKIYIGDFVLQVDAEGDQLSSPSSTSGSDLKRKAPPPLPAKKRSKSRSRPTEMSPSAMIASQADASNERLTTPADDVADSDSVASAVSVSKSKSKRASRISSIERAAEAKTAASQLASGALSQDVSASSIKPSKRKSKKRLAEEALAREQRKREEEQDVEAKLQLRREIHDRLADYVRLQQSRKNRLVDEEGWEKVEAAICDIVEALEGEGALPADIDQGGLVRDILVEAVGYGALEDLLSDETVESIIVNGAEEIFVERDGRSDVVDRRFSSEEVLLDVINRLIAPNDIVLGEDNPLVDTRLRDGSHINAVASPVSVRGPSVTIRKSKRSRLQADDLVEADVLTREMCEFLEMCVAARRNIIVSGAVGAGKTTLLNAIGTFVPDGERIIAIEHAVELFFERENCVQLSGLASNPSESTPLSVRRLVENALRMKPDRIILGDCLGAEAAEVLGAMSAGFVGTMTAVNASSIKDALFRLEGMALMSGINISRSTLREQIAETVGVVIHVARLADGSRRVMQVAELNGILDDDQIGIEEVFAFHEGDYDQQGRVRGRHVPSGFVPRFYQDLRRRGIPVNMSIFKA